MFPVMYFSICLCVETSRTEFTLERFLWKMLSFVDFKTGGAGISPKTNITYMVLLPVVALFMNLQVGVFVKPLAALVTFKRFFARVRNHMSVEI